MTQEASLYSKLRPRAPPEECFCCPPLFTKEVPTPWGPGISGNSQAEAACGPA